MANKIRRLGITIVLGIILLFGLLSLALSYTAAGVISEVGGPGFSLLVHSLSAVPQSVVEDATVSANELFGDYQDGCDSFVSQLLTMYSEARDKDFVIVFNPGGWGWSLAEASPDWESILGGIKSELDSSGYKSLLLDYQRTTETLRGCFNEAAELVARYPSKARELAASVEFLTENIPDLRVIIAGESNGAVISDSAMHILGDNPQVYSIQTGPPFWYKNQVSDRTLVLTDNGVTPDSFSRGDFLTMIISNLKALLGVSQSEGDSGTVLYHVRAPGHEYWWDYPGVYSEILSFLRQNFRIVW